jgi:hypothetical protein
MDIQNNNNYKYEKNNKIRDLSYKEINELRKFLENKEINELKDVLENKCLSYSDNINFRRIYDLFINNVIPELNTNNKDYIDNLYYLGVYYQYIKNDYDLMKKYYFMAIGRGYLLAVWNMESYYECNLPNDEDLQNYFNSLIRGNYLIKCFGFDYCFTYIDGFIEENRKVDLFCIEIDNNNLKIENFKFCLSDIVIYINSHKSYKLCETCGLKNIKHFARYINKLLYNIKNKSKYKKYTNKIFMVYASQIFMEYLDFHYYKYLEKIFAPGGKGYIKTKNHFELITKQQQIINKK